MASGSLHLSNLKEPDEDCSNQDKLMPLYAVSVIFAVGVTLALVLQICLGESLVCHATYASHAALFVLITVASQDVTKGVVVSDHERCTALGHRVLHDRGSSVDAAITVALCLGVMHPHVSGVGGYVTR